MEAPKYILDIMACLDDKEDNLEQIIDGFECELLEDGKLSAFKSYVNVMTCSELANLLRIAYNIPNVIESIESNETQSFY